MKKLIVLGVFLVAAGLGIFFFIRSRGPDAPRYETAEVKRSRVTAKVTASGTLSALVTVQVGSQVSGRIAEITKGVDFNAKVTKGQVIAKIDPQLFDAALEQAKANYLSAQANLTKARVQALDAERQFARANTLASQKLIATADRDTAQAAADAARAQVAASAASVAQAKASMHSAEVNLGFTTITSPIDGVVISRNVDVGQTVASALQAPTLFTIAEDLRKMQVDTSVAEADVGRLEPGTTATFTVDAYPGERFRGKVRQIRSAPQTVQNVVTYDAVIDVENPALPSGELKLRPGMTANVTFVYAERSDVLVVPNAALRFRPPGAPTPGAGPMARAAGRPAGAGRPDRTGADGPTSAPASAESLPASGPSSRPAWAGRRQGGEGQPLEKTVWVLKATQPTAVTVKTGLSDGSITEIVEGDLHEGDLVITDAVGGESKPANPGFPGGAGGGGGGLRRVL